MNTTTITGPGIDETTPIVEHLSRELEETRLRLAQLEMRRDSNGVPLPSPPPGYYAAESDALWRKIGKPENWPREMKRLLMPNGPTREHYRKYTCPWEDEIKPGTVICPPWPKMDTHLGRKGTWVFRSYNLDVPLYQQGSYFVPDEPDEPAAGQ